MKRAKSKKKNANPTPESSTNNRQNQNQTEGSQIKLPPYERKPVEPVVVRASVTNCPLCRYYSQYCGNVARHFQSMHMPEFQQVLQGKASFPGFSVKELSEKETARLLSALPKKIAAAEIAARRRAKRSSAPPILIRSSEPKCPLCSYTSIFYGNVARHFQIIHKTEFQEVMSDKTTFPGITKKKPGQGRQGLSSYSDGLPNQKNANVNSFPPNPNSNPSPASGQAPASAQTHEIVQQFYPGIIKNERNRVSDSEMGQDTKSVFHQTSTSMYAPEFHQQQVSNEANIYPSVGKKKGGRGRQGGQGGQGQGGQSGHSGQGGHGSQGEHGGQGGHGGQGHGGHGAQGGHGGHDGHGGHGGQGHGGHGGLPPGPYSYTNVLPDQKPYYLLPPSHAQGSIEECFLRPKITPAQSQFQFQSCLSNKSESESPSLNWSSSITDVSDDHNQEIENVFKDINRAPPTLFRCQDSHCDFVSDTRYNLLVHQNFHQIVEYMPPFVKTIIEASGNVDYVMKMESELNDRLKHYSLLHSENINIPEGISWT